MEDDKQTSTTDTAGKEADKPSEKDKETPSEYDKLKEDNDKMEVELVRKQKLRKDMASEKLLGGEAGGHVDAPVAKEETPKEYNERIEKEISEGKHDD